MAQTFDEVWVEMQASTGGSYEAVSGLWEDLQTAKAEQHRLQTAMGIACDRVGEYRQSEASAVARERDTHEKLTAARANMERMRSERDRLDKLLGGALEREALLRDKLHEDERTAQLGREIPTEPDVPADLPNGDVWAVADCINYLLARERERT